jgi:hypothetical protein
MHASWATYYLDLPGLINASDVVVVGTVSEILPPQRHGQDPNDPQYLTTESVVTISDVLTNPGQEAISDSQLTVVQTGGMTDNVLYQVDDDPIFKPNETLVLFLVRNAGGTYRTAGGPSGRFEVSHGRVTASADNAVPAKDVAMDKFEQMVAAAK